MTSTQVWPRGGQQAYAVSSGQTWPPGGPKPVPAVLGYAATILSDNPIGYWRMGETSAATTAADSSPNNYPLTISPSGNAPYSFGQTGARNILDSPSVLCNGSGNQAMYTTQSGLISALNAASAANHYSLEAWFKTTSATLQGLIGRDDLGGGNRQFQFRLETSGAIGFIPFNSGGTSFVFATTPTYKDGSWHHAVAVLSGTTAIIYVDGVAVFTGSISGTGAAPSGQELAVAALSGPGGISPFNSKLVGSIDEVAVYGTALSATQVAAHYAAAFVLPALDYDTQVLADSPLVYWKLDETSGTTMTDSSPNARNGTYSGATLNQSPLLPVGTGKAALGTTSGQGIGSIASATWMNADAFTAECWVKVNNTNDVAGIFSRFNGSGTGWWVIWQRSGNLSCTMADGGSSQRDLNSGVALVAGRIYHVVQVVSGTTQSIYINGVLAASMTITALSGSNAGSAAMQLGGYNGGNFSAATVDNAAYYGTALSPARIRAHYVAGQPSLDSYDTAVFTDTPFAYWKLNEPVNAAAFDASGGGRNGAYLGGVTLASESTTRGNAVAFDGSSGYMRVPANSLDNWTFASWTMEIWAKFNPTVPTADQQRLIMTSQFISKIPLSLGLDINGPGAGNAGKFMGAFYDGTFRWVASPGTLANGWHHLACTYTSNSFVLYIDGVQVATATSGGVNPSAPSSNPEFYIAHHWDTGGAVTFLAISAQRAAVYNTALSATRIAAHYAAG